MKTDNQPKLAWLPYVIAGLSYIPLLGIVFGLIAIFLGILKRKSGGWKVVVIGAGGIAFTVVIYSALFYVGFVRRGGVADDLRLNLARTSLDSVVQAIEVYKLQNGKYPDSLKTLQKSLPKESLVNVIDPTAVPFVSPSRDFYYEVVDEDHYYLFSVGPDGKPFTSDDILPTVQSKPGSKVGLLVRAPSQNGK